MLPEHSHGGEELGKSATVFVMSDDAKGTATHRSDG